jgi:transketolase
LNGGYVVSDGDEITIFASGSELNLAFALKKNLSEYSVRIVSVPILNKLNPEKATSLKNSNLTFTIELGKSVGWANYIGDITDSFSLETFGKSAPEDDLSKFFNLNVETIEKKIRHYLD